MLECVSTVSLAMGYRSYMRAAEREEIRHLKCQVACPMTNSSLMLCVQSTSSMYEESYEESMKNMTSCTLRVQEIKSQSRSTLLYLGPTLALVGPTYRFLVIKNVLYDVCVVLVHADSYADAKKDTCIQLEACSVTVPLSAISWAVSFENSSRLTYDFSAIAADWLFLYPPPLDVRGVVEVDKS